MERSRHHLGLLQKLYCREIHGTFSQSRSSVNNKASQLFNKIPDRLMFYLKDVLKDIENHIMIGTTRCGQFVLTYTFTFMSFKYKYVLHWWAFRPSAPAYKVAEVQLFDSQDIKYSLTIGIAHWPHVNDKLVVFGTSEELIDVAFSSEVDPYECEEYRKCYITVTTLPSLHGCKDCKTVAESFSIEDMAAAWDRAVNLSCLKHGLTIHTTLDIAAPFPSLDLLTSLKVDNKIIINNGNFLHVLTFGDNLDQIKASHDDTIVPEEITHNIGETLSFWVKDYICPWKTKPRHLIWPSRRTMTRSVNSAWLNTIMDRAEKVYAFEEPEEGCESTNQWKRFSWFRKRRIADKLYDFCSDDEDMENRVPPPKLPRLSTHTQYTPLRERPLISERSQDSERDRRKKSELEKNENIILAHKPLYFVDTIRTKQKEIEWRRRQAEILCKGNVPSNSCDNDECATQRLGEASSRLNEEITVVDGNVSYRNNCDNFNKVSVKEQSSTQITSPSDSDCRPSEAAFFNVPSLDILPPDLNALLAEWEADSVSSLSPRSDSFLCRKGETKNDVIQSFLELIPGVAVSPKGSNNPQRTSDSSTEGTGGVETKYPPLLVVLRARNSNQDKEQEDKCSKAVVKEEGIARVKAVKDSDLQMRQRMISGCSVRFDRIYIEVDEEIISITEDDDEDTGFHCALPLSVHGSAYAQLQMVTSQKAERMSMHCERVYQTSLDIEQFCFKAAEMICKCEGFKFWFCNDYDVEIIDVCALNGDILGVLVLRVNAEKKPPKTEKYSTVNQRHYYETQCVFIWNPVSDRCWLEAYTQLVDVTGHRPHEPTSQWAPARHEAARLKRFMYNSHFALDPYPNICVRTHRMWTNGRILTPPLEIIEDLPNLIGFKLRDAPSPSQSSY